MKKFIPRHFRSFWVKVTLVLVIAMLFIAVMNSLLIYNFAYQSQFNDLRQKLMIIAQTAALSVDKEALRKIPLNPDGKNTAEFKAVSEKIKQIIAINPPIKNIYILAKTEKEGAWQFIADVVVPEKDGKNLRFAYPGDFYDASRFPEMLKGFTGPAADKRLERDEWGITLSGYAPIRDDSANAIAVLGVDISADDVYFLQNNLFKRALFILFFGVILSLVLGLFVSRGITERIKKIVDGSRHLAAGQLRYRIDVRGSDEISELAGAFNRMASSLASSRRKLVTYFYRVVQSLVRILEAKDHYTRGHSERVAEFSGKIAIKMGFSEEKAELLKETALLHDIGKLGIQEIVLNKKEKLTEEEWRAIREHPAVGEDILKPVLLSKEMLEVVREHHERYDGSGYPDKMKGESINLFAAIVSVADAYDAMTSERAYRKGLDKSEAIKELSRNKGSQFNPQVVDAFLKVLETEA